MRKIEPYNLNFYDTLNSDFKNKEGKTTERLPRIDQNLPLKEKILPFCRLKYGEIWEDPIFGHRVGVLDATKLNDLLRLTSGSKAELIINDPPYNVSVGNARSSTTLFKMDLNKYITFSTAWVANIVQIMSSNSHLYVWIGADQKEGFQPLPDFMIMMRQYPQLKSRSFITLRNQRGYGTQNNWMWIRQELLYYVKGKPSFRVVYTDIPKVLKGYYKVVNGEMKENLERSKSNTIRPGNVWIDIQQVFYRMEENVPGCYAQKPLKAIERLIESSSSEKGIVVDCFSHSGTTLIAGERLKRKVLTCDIDPVFAELTIRRLEHYRATGKPGWQWNNPFPEVDPNIKATRWS